MPESERTIIELPEICRVEGHSSVTVVIEDNKVRKVELEVFEGTRFFERIVVGHQYDEMPHITSRICAICSTGHVLASLRSFESLTQFAPSRRTSLLRRLMHLGMIIESHATHICALALPDFLGANDLTDLAVKHPDEFAIWTKLRNYGSLIQTIVGGRPFHPVTLHVGGFSHVPSGEDLARIAKQRDELAELPPALYNLLTTFKMPVTETKRPVFMALVPDEGYGYWGESVRSTNGFESPITQYKDYLDERVVEYSHAKRSLFQDNPIMVGSIARLHLYGERLSKPAKALLEKSPLLSDKFNILWNNLAQAIEIVDAFDQVKAIVAELQDPALDTREEKFVIQAGLAYGAVECPRGTLYHHYQVDAQGRVLAADMITPSAQNSAQIEFDIKTVVEQKMDLAMEAMKARLEPVIRAYDPCNTCATHMVTIKRT